MHAREIVDLLSPGKQAGYCARAVDPILKDDPQKQHPDQQGDDNAENAFFS